MSSYAKPTAPPSFRTILDAWAQDPNLPCRDVLNEAQIHSLAQEENVSFGEGPGCIWSVAVTVWAFLAQTLSQDKACTAAVARVMVLLIALGREPCAGGTSAYCKARAKLPERFLQRLACGVGARLEDAVPADWRWKGRRVLLADGSTVLLPDTPNNQQEYPQMKAQKPGVGFPILRLVVLLGLASGAALAAAMGPYRGKQTGETALLRTLFGHLRGGDVLVADRYYASYWMVALAVQRGVDVVFRMHQLRHYDFRRGRRLGAYDHVVTWKKPHRPKWMDAATYASLPATVSVRELQITVTTPGIRAERVLVATTLLDETTYRKDELATLYRQRWHAELDLRSLKTYLGMEMLRCKTAAMCRKELWMHLLTYTLVRKVQAQAAQQAGVQPRRLSFTGTLQALGAFRLLLVMAEDNRTVVQRCLLQLVAQHRVGNRPDRCEPRKVKRRPKSYGLLTRPRAVERAALLAS
jgi:Transposase DDE domain